MDEEAVAFAIDINAGGAGSKGDGMAEDEDLEVAEVPGGKLEDARMNGISPGEENDRPDADL